MIRRAVLVGAVLLSAAASVHLMGETRGALRAREPVAATLARAGARAPGVVIVLQPRDCLGDGTLVRQWNALAATPGLPVRGLVVSPARRDASVPQTGLTIPLSAVSPGDAALVGERLGFRATPFAVVLDRHGRVAAAFPAGRAVPPEVLASMLGG